MNVAANRHWTADRLNIGLVREYLLRLRITGAQNAFLFTKRFHDGLREQLALRHIRYPVVKLLERNLQLL